MSRTMVKLIHVDAFYADESIPFYLSAVSSLPFQPREFGEEIPDFSLIIPGMEPLFSRVVGERVKIDGKRSGIFRKPTNGLIHFEDFESPDEWCFIAALQPNTLNIWNHISEPDKGEVSPIDSAHALKGYQFNYLNLFEWKVHTNVLLNANDGVFIRPWMFHSLQDNIVQYYRLIADKKFRILIMGLPGSGRSSVARKLSEIIPNSELLISKEIRVTEKDIDYSVDGKMRNMYRVLDMARESQKDTVIIDMLCPLQDMREILCADIIVWMDRKDTINISEDILKDWQPPTNYDLRFQGESEEIYDLIIERIRTKRY